jgi:hypothetical protein
MFGSTLAVLLVLSAATPLTPPGCGMANELKVIAAANNTRIAFRRAAALLAEQGKWRAAATAQESAANDADDASRLLLAFYVLRSGDLARTEHLLRDLDPSPGAHWIAAELALERNDAETAAEELEAARAEKSVGDTLSLICCRGRTIDSATIDILLQARVALLRDHAATAVQLLREVETPEGRLFFARALKIIGQTAEAVRELEKLGRELPPCAGVWREHVLFEAALTASEIDTATAETLYQETIEAAEAQEEAFTAAVHEAHVNLQTPVTGLFVAAMREPRHAAPESRNNLGHLLIARANRDMATLMVAQAELRKAAQSRDYATPQYAYIGLARAALAAGDREVAATEVMNALWRAPQHNEALEIARILIRDAPLESRLGLGVVFTGITSETLPRRFITREYGRELVQLDNVAATHDDELARHYDAVRALAQHEFEQARRLAKAARAKSSSSDWPEAVEAAALIATGRNEEAQTIYRALAERVARNPPRTAWDAATLRTAALAFSDVAKEGDDPTTRTAAATLIAEVARPAVASGRPFPWESRTGLTASVVLGGDNVALPGAEITLFTETGPRSEITDDQGQWRARDLPPGFYSVLAELSGMQSSGGIAKVTSGETEVAFALPIGAVTEAITLTAERPPVDQLPQSTRNYAADEVLSLPILGRNLANLQINGASSAENSYLIDGVNVTDASLAIPSGNLFLSSAIQELSVITSGYSAEFGHASGGVISVVSRSGTNKFNGKVTVEAARDVKAAEPVAMSRALANERDEEILRFQAGGPLQRDRFFWFASGDLQQERGKAQPALQLKPPPQGQSSDRELDLFTKLSGSFTSVFVSLSAKARQKDRDGVVEDPGGSVFGTASSTDRRQETRDDTLILLVNKEIGTATFVDVSASRTQERSSLRPGHEAADAIQIRFPEAGFFTAGGMGFINDGRDFERTSARAKISTFLLGSHELAGGVEAEWDDDAISDRISGGMLVDAESDFHRFWAYGDDPRPVSAVHETFQSGETSAFINDTWTLRRVIVLAGLRWTRQNVDFPRELELSTSALQPRLGIAVHPLDDNRWKIYANYGRFFEPIRRDERVAYGSDRRYNVAPPGLARPFEAQSYGRLSAIDPDLRARLSDAWGAGVEHGDRWYWQLGAQYQRLASHIEDFFCTADRMRCIGNPGSGIMRTLQSEGGGLRQSPRARREHLYLTGRIWQRPRSSYWELAYTWLRAKGNTDPPDLASTRVVGIDPYARSAFDFAELVSNGALAAPRHSLRANAFTTLQDVISTHDVVLSAALSAQSRVPRGAFGYSPLYGRYVTTLVPRGEQSDGPARVSLDVGIDYIVPIGESELKFSLIGRNLFDSQTSRVDDQRALLPVSDLETIPNPTFLQPMERNEPRSLRASVMLSF